MAFINGREVLFSTNFFKYNLTEEDKAEIINGVIDALGGNPVFGYIDESNSIVLSGNIPNGTYSIKYEMEDGETVGIGDLTFDIEIVSYDIFNYLTGCTNNNSVNRIIEGDGYYANISANSGYNLSSVTVTMGGVDITASAVSGGAISIASVTGSIVIKAVAEKTATAEPKNFALPLSVGRLSNSASGYITTSNAEARRTTEYVLVQNGDIVTLSGVDATVSASINTYMVFDGSKAKLADLANWSSGTSNVYVEVTEHDNSGCTVKIASDSVSYIRFCSTPAGADEDVVVNIKRNGEWVTE